MIPPGPATKRLFVLRHAKSSWDQRGLADHDRPLAPRGIRATELLCDHLLSQRICPALILCSSARRARETLERAVLPALPTPGEFLIEPGLYEASASELLERLRRTAPETPSVMVIGHNPALHILLATLAENVEKFPTGALATLTFTGTWVQLGASPSELTGFVRPRDLG